MPAVTQTDKRNTHERELMSNRTYKIAFTIAAVLLLLTLTGTVVLIIISSGREEDREAEFETTLTAVHDDLRLTETGVAVAVQTQDAAPPLTQGEYPFAAPDLTWSSAEDDCAGQMITGVVLGLIGDPTDAYQVVVWGDLVEPQFLLTGEPAGQEPGQWAVTLSGITHRRVWVQLVAGGRYYAAPVELVFDADDCTRNQVEVVFTQVAPLE